MALTPRRTDPSDHASPRLAPSADAFQEAADRPFPAAASAVSRLEELAHLAHRAAFRADHPAAFPEVALQVRHPEVASADAAASAADHQHQPHQIPADHRAR